MCVCVCVCVCVLEIIRRLTIAGGIYRYAQRGISSRYIYTSVVHQSGIKIFVWKIQELYHFCTTSRNQISFLSLCLSVSVSLSLPPPAPPPPPPTHTMALAVSHCPPPPPHTHTHRYTHTRNENQACHITRFQSHCVNCA